MLYRGYDLAALDAQYNNQARVPHFQTWVSKWQARSAEVRAMDGVQQDVAYGEAEGMTLDIHPPIGGAGGGRAPMLLFFHGGYWQARDKTDFAFVVDGFTRHGALVLNVNYALCPSVSMTELVEQCRHAVVWAYRRAGEIGGDAERLFVSGHSAGGHIVAELAGTDWIAFASGLPRDAVKGGVAISGLYDLEPMRLCYLNDKLKLDAPEARALSPIHHVPPRLPPLLFTVGGAESEEFLRQQADYVAALRRSRHGPGEIAMPGHDHFSIIDAFADAEGPLARATRGLMGLP